MEYSPATAKLYDKVLFPAMVRIRKRMVQLAKELKVNSVIDFCCGTGDQLKYFRRHGFEQAIGVDLSENMVAQAQKGRIKADCLLEDATQTSQATGSFDFGMVSFALHEKPIETAQAMLAEARRVVKKGGYFAVADYCFDEKTQALGRWGSTLVEYFAGGEHYQNFKTYTQKGGLDFLLSGFEMQQEYRFIFGSVCLRLYAF